MQHALLGGHPGGPHTQQPPHSRTGCCAHALRVPKAARRLQRCAAPLAAATLDAPETQQAEYEEQDELPEAQGHSASNGVPGGGGMSMEHPDKRALYERFFQLLSQDLSPRYEVGDRVVGRVLRCAAQL